MAQWENLGWEGPGGSGQPPGHVEPPPPESRGGWLWWAGDLIQLKGPPWLGPGRLQGEGLWVSKKTYLCFRPEEFQAGSS